MKPIIQSRVRISFCLTNSNYVYACVSFKGEQKTFSLGIKIENREEWGKGGVDGDSPNAMEVAEELAEIKYRVLKMRPKPNWSMVNVLAALKGEMVDTDIPMTIRDVCKYHNKSKKTMGVAQNTLKFYRIAYTAVDAWMDYKGMEDIHISELSRQDGRDFYEYLTKEKGYAEVTVCVYVNYVNQCIKFAADEFIDHPAMISISPWRNLVKQPDPESAKEKAINNHLTASELDLVENTYIKGKCRRGIKYEWMKWTALWQAYTGFSFKDLGSPYWGIEKTESGDMLWLKRGKTKRNCYLPLTSKMKMIMEKLKSFEGERLFPFDEFVLNEKMEADEETLRHQYDEYRMFLMRNLSPATGLKIKSHTMRHSFGMMAVNDWGIPIEDVAAMMGHSDTKTTMRNYVRVEKKRIMSHLDKMNA